jgi:hypothetical protein
MPGMVTTHTRRIEVDTRALIQNAKLSIRDVYDAIVELVTNCDDRYQVLARPGKIEIEVERSKGGRPSVLRVRDFADGMTSDVMDRKLSRLGGRVSGLESGLAVRGTNSRGAKDVAALGTVRFESIAEDRRFHCCEITEYFEYVSHPPREITKELRQRIGIHRGTGTLVTIEVQPQHTVPRHDNLAEHVALLVPLRGVVSDPERKIVVRDLVQDRETTLAAPRPEGEPRVKESFEVPGYPGARAKLVIHRARKPFEREKARFRRSGILIRSRHAVHESTYFAPELENDAHALRFFGKLTCPHLDELWNAFDDAIELRTEPDPANPRPILDPMRRTGLTRDHPFVEALFGEALKRFRPLVEEERQRDERQRAAVESEATRKRLDALEKAAVRFMQEFGEEDEPARDPDGRDVESRFREVGYALNPPFAQMVQGEARRFWFNVHQTTFPELEVGSDLRVECLSDDLTVDRPLCAMQLHPTREGVLRAIWTVKALRPTPATGVRVRAGSIVAESLVEVLESEAHRYLHVEQLCFSHRRYRLSTESRRKRIRIYAPLEAVPAPTRLEVDVAGDEFSLAGEPILKPQPKLGVAVCDLHAKSSGDEARSVLTARLNGTEATAEIVAVLPMGAGLSIRLEDIDLGDQRYRWRQNVLEIAAKHPSIRRYLGDKAQGFPGQEARHFRVLIAEIVAQAVCAQVISRNALTSPEDYSGADWDDYYAEFSRLMTRFLPTAHKLQCPEGPG